MEMPMDTIMPEFKPSMGRGKISASFLLRVVVGGYCLLWGISCGEGREQVAIPEPTHIGYLSDTLKLSKEAYYDKVLGTLVGSAIGDAMGASTEMWHRRDIQLRYGYITALTPAIREQSPEGTWGHNLAAGATTDDTRWKYLMVKYFSAHYPDLNPSDFAQFISYYYQTQTKKLSKEDLGASPDALEAHMERIDWIKEWARVALAYQRGPEPYQKAVGRFYGGEMSCAGQLYTPMFGLVGGTPEISYQLAYDHALFDLGYAKDISAILAAMTHTALRVKSMDSILNSAVFVDPLEYQNSRLVGRIAYNIADNAIKTVLEIQQGTASDSVSLLDSISFRMPSGFPASQRDWIAQERTYRLLEKDARAIPFHAGEIWQITVTALAFGEGDFEKTLQFVVNYGRDNDTVGAIVGAILGARLGYAGLPEAIGNEIIRVNREVMGIDLPTLAQEMTDLTYATQ